MALETNGNGMGTTMLVGPASVGGGMPYPVYAGQGGNGGNGMFGDQSWWVVLLIIILFAAGGWNNGVNGNGGFSGNGAPIVISDGNGGSVQRGFDQAAIMGGLSGIQSGISGLSTQLCGCCGDIQNSLCNGFAGVTAAVTGAQNAVSQQLYANTIADMNRSFAAQTATTQGFTGVNTGLADIKYTIASEECATRNNSTQNTQGILNAINGGIQSIKDQLCQDKIDAKNDEIATLRQQIAMKDLAASQASQNAFIQQGFSNEVDALYNRLNNCPVPSTPVFGRTPIFTCNQSGGCGCNGGFMN